jgi:hypothetical protein
VVAEKMRVIVKCIACLPFVLFCSIPPCFAPHIPCVCKPPLCCAYRTQVLAHEVSLAGGNGAPVRYITTLLTLLTLLLLLYRFFCDLVFKMYEFLERNQKNTLEDDDTDPFSYRNLSEVWVGVRLARLSFITLKMNPWLLPSFLAEMFIICIHTPPVTIDKYLSTQASGAVASYSEETVILSFMCLRFYVVFKVIRAYIADRYSGAKSVTTPAFLAIADCSACTGTRPLHQSRVCLTRLQILADC